MRLRILVLAGLFTRLLAAQGSGVIFGNVTDSSGAVVPGVALTLTNVATGATDTVKSNTEGYYLFPDLGPGSYRIIAEFGGMQSSEKTGIVLQVDQRARIDITMQVGEAKSVVTVAAEVTNIDTFSSTTKDVVDSARIVDLPLNGRNALTLQALLPGTIIQGQGSAATTIAVNTNTVFSVNGARATESSYTLDGGLNMDMYNNTPAVFPNPDMLQEFSILQNVYNAASGRDAGAVINMITKSGTNSIHGTLYEFVRNNDFDARNFFATGENPLHRNQFGGTLGGPLVLPHYNGKDKTFFFIGAEVTRQIYGPTSSSTIVPTQLERQGNFSHTVIGGKPITVANPSTVTASNPTGTPYPNATIPAASLDPVAVAFANAFVPLPNQPGNVFSFNLAEPTNDAQYIIKLDQNITANHRLSLRFFRDDTVSTQNAGLPLSQYALDWPTSNGALNYTYTISPTLVNALNITVARNTLNRSPLPTNPPASWISLGCTSCLSLAPAGTPTQWQLTIANGAGINEPDYYRSYMMNYQLIDTVSWTKGKHFFTLGGDIAKVIRNGYEFQSAQGNWAFGGTLSGPSGDGYADFFQGAATSLTQYSEFLSAMYKWTPFLFANDDWRISKRLTLNLGVRWEPFITPKNGYNVAEAFRPGQQSTIYPHAPKGLVFPGDPGMTNGVVSDGYNKFSPRVGFAYDVFGDGKMSVRGGYGIFRDTLPIMHLVSFDLNVPFVAQSILFGVPLSKPYASNQAAAQYLTNFFSPNTPQERSAFTFNLPVAAYSIAPNFTSAYAQQWNFTIQREIWKKTVLSVGYLGTKGTDLPRFAADNPAIYIPGQSTASNVNSRRIYPSFQAVGDIYSDANSTYHALQISWSRRLANGFSILGSYAWSKAIDLHSSEGSGGGYGAGGALSVSDPFYPGKDKGLADFNVTSRFVTSFIWNLPWLQGGHGLRAVALGGWQINGILTVQSGAPFTILAGVDRSLAGINLDHADVLKPVAIYGNVSKYFDTSAFALPALGTFGTTGRNTIVGPGLANLDTSLFKEIRVNESKAFEIRWEIFNSLNRANFLNPSGTFSSPAFGRITAAGPPRIIQLGAKFRF